MRVLILFFLLIGFAQSFSQDYSVLEKERRTLKAALAISDSTFRKQDLDKWWNNLVAEKRIPLVAEDSAIFMYRGTANPVVWMGDFNGWGYDKNFKNKGKRFSGTDLWILKCSFPKDARIDYKLFVDGGRWILDPENPYRQWSGVGGGSPNSELRMPGWKEDPILKHHPEFAHGTVIPDLLISSKILGYQITYSVYLPVGYEKHGKLPVVYVTDGFEYMLPELGNMVTVLDNLIAEKKIEPIAAIFIDHREPVNRSNNRRMEELNMSEKYLKFFAQEFIPHVEEKFPIHRDAAHRAILGTSMGGLTAAYFAFTRPDLFSMAGIQSPAFWARPQIYSVCDNANAAKIKVSLTSGTMNDASEGSHKLKAILQKHACVYHYRENNEGHSWGNWKNQIDDVLIDLFAKQ